MMGFFMMMLLFSFGVLANRDKVNGAELGAAYEEIFLLKMEIAHLEEALNECVAGFLCAWLLDLSTRFFFLIQCRRDLFIDAPIARCTMPRLARTRTHLCEIQRECIDAQSVLIQTCLSNKQDSHCARGRSGLVHLRVQVWANLLPHRLALDGYSLTPTSRTRGRVRFSHNSVSIAPFLSVTRFDSAGASASLWSLVTLRGSS